MARWWSVLALSLALAACGGDEGAEGELTVFAAASLSAAFAELGDAYADVDPDAALVFSFAGSSDLAAQVLEDAPADVFASADLSNMTRVTDAAKAAGEPVVFATNVAEIIVEAGNPNGITSVTDLADDDLIVVQCAAQVPCGRYAEQVLANAGVSVSPKSFEGNVSAVVTKVTLGEADAGIVYRTDALAAADQADGVAIPADINVVAQYPIATLANASNPQGADRFVEFVLGDEGQAILASYGFGPP
jgi:molybdate transport system substrate-binding protein